MPELLLIVIFACALLACVLAGVSVLVALAFGYMLFFGYGLWRGRGWRLLLSDSLAGMRTVVVVLSAFCLIGALTASWRACGTIATIVSWSYGACQPGLMVPATFLLCSLVSLLTGTSFGSAATMGVICMAMAGSMGISPALAGGAMLSGVYFGDRCSPMSTSALLVCALTRTSLHDNLRRMLRTGAVPFAITLAAYAALAPAGSPAVGTPVPELLEAHFTLTWPTLLPAVIVLVLAFLRVGVKTSMGLSLACALVLAVAVQGMPPGEALLACVTGFSPADPDIARLLGGGGVLSMATVFCIVCVASCYAGIFRGTRFLDGVIGHVRSLARRVTPFGAVLATAVLTSVVACNQTLAIMLTHQLCEPLARRRDLAIHLENTAVVIAPLVPWSIAGAVPLALCGAPLSSLPLSFLLVLIPLWNLAMALRGRGGGRRVR